MTERLPAGNYDETEIADRLTALLPADRALFTCACAERLMPALQWFCDAVGSVNYMVVREALDAAWSLDDACWAAGQYDLGALLPCSEEGDLALASTVAMNAVACVVYALEVCKTGEVQKAVWAARQLYEAADSLVQQGSALHAYLEEIDQEPPVQLLVRGIYAALDAAHNVPSADLLVSARYDGEAFLGYMIRSG